ncbi:MAG: MmcQ/YjbR family DNA-binding protein [Pedococcus sp.]
MTLDEVDEYATSLPGCRRKGHPGRVAWYVDNRLVVRQDEAGTLLVRVDPEDRDRLVDAHPETFGVPPRWEAHRKVQAELDGDADAVRAAIRLAWESQRR